MISYIINKQFQRNIFTRSYCEAISGSLKNSGGTSIFDKYLPK